MFSKYHFNDIAVWPSLRWCLVPNALHLAFLGACLKSHVKTRKHSNFKSKPAFCVLGFEVSDVACAGRRPMVFMEFLLQIRGLRLQFAVLLHPDSANTTAPLTLTMLAEALSKLRAAFAEDAHPTFSPRRFSTGISEVGTTVRRSSWKG